MSDIKDFVIDNGVLRCYTGNDSDVVIPEGVRKIQSLRKNEGALLLPQVDMVFWA